MPTHAACPALIDATVAAMAKTASGLIAQRGATLDCFVAREGQTLDVR